MYHLIEYSDTYSDTSGSLWQFKRDEVTYNNADFGIDDNGKHNPQSFKYKAALAGKQQIIIIEINQTPLINRKVNLELKWIEDCILSSNLKYLK